jgi:hypothetical protein
VGVIFFLRYFSIEIVSNKCLLHVAGCRICLKPNTSTFNCSEKFLRDPNELTSGKVQPTQRVIEKRPHQIAIDSYLPPRYSEKMSFQSLKCIL